MLAPPAVPHTFGNLGPEETRILAFYTPGGMDRFIAELGKLRSMDDPGFRAFANLFERYDTDAGGRDRPGGPAGARHRAPGEGEHLSVGGGAITILADSAATGGSFAVVDYTAPPGFPGPPPHRHREIVDVFYVLEGELDAGGRGRGDRGASPGRWWWSRPGRCTQFSNPSDRPARFLGVVSPGGFEQYFRDVAAAIGDGPFDPAVAAPLIAKYDYEAA